MGEGAHPPQGDSAAEAGRVPGPSGGAHLQQTTRLPRQHERGAPRSLWSDRRRSVPPRNPTPLTARANAVFLDMY